MRRVLALVLLALFGLPAVAPAFAQDAPLAACCRRNGAHHCSGMMSAQNSSAPSIAATCPRFHQPTTIAAQHTVALLPSTHAHILYASEKKPLRKTTPRLPLRQLQPRASRGPPASFLA